MNKKSSYIISIITLFTALMIVSGCGNRYVHIDLPDNNFQFTAEGGTSTYTYAEDYLEFGGIMINGVSVLCEPIFHEETYIGVEANGWLRFYDRGYTGERPDTKVIEVLPNTTGKARSAKIHFSIPGGNYYEGKIFVHQSAQ